MSVTRFNEHGGPHNECPKCGSLRTETLVGNVPRRTYCFDCKIDYPIFAVSDKAAKDEIPDIINKLRKFL